MESIQDQILQVGEILYDDLLYILPFENTVDLVTMKGRGIRNVLEKACYKINPDNVNDYNGSFGYQVANPNCSVKLFWRVKTEIQFDGVFPGGGIEI